MDRLRAILGVLIGIGLIIGGIVTLSDDSVKCGSQTMSEGDVCVEYGDGETTERSLSEQKDDNTQTGFILLGIGVLMLGGGIYFFFNDGRKKAAAAAAGQAPPMPPGPQGYGPPPMAPAQGMPAQQGPPMGAPPPLQYGPPPQAAPPGYPPPQQPPPAGQQAGWGPPPSWGPPPGR